MPVIYPYENQPVAVHFDSGYYPKAVEIGGAVVRVENRPFLDPHTGVNTTLTRGEATALAGVSVGMRMRSLDETLGVIEEEVSTLCSKFAARRPDRPGELAVATAFWKDILQPDQPPLLTSLRTSWRAHFLGLTSLLPTTLPSRILTGMHGLRCRDVAVERLFKDLARDLDLSYLEDPGPAFALLAGAAQALPPQEDVQAYRPGQELVVRPKYHIFDPPTDPKERRSFTHTIVEKISNRSGDTPAELWFVGQPKYLERANVRIGQIVKLVVHSVPFAVHNVALPLAGGGTHLTSVEMAAFLFRCAGLSYSQTARKIGLYSDHIDSAYAKLLGPKHSATGKSRALERGLDIALKSKMIVPLEHADFDLSSRNQWAFPKILPYLRQGWKDRDIDEAVGKTASQWNGTPTYLMSMRGALGVTNAGLILLDEASRLPPGTVREDPMKRIGEQIYYAEPS